MAKAIVSTVRSKANETPSRPIPILLPVSQHLEVQVLDFCSRPRCFAQKLQAGGNRRVAGETADVYAHAQLLPAVVFNQAGHDFLEGDTVQRVVGLLFTHGLDYDFPLGRLPVWHGRPLFSTMENFGSDSVQVLSLFADFCIFKRGLEQVENILDR